MAVGPQFKRSSSWIQGQKLKILFTEVEFLYFLWIVFPALEWKLSLTALCYDWSDVYWVCTAVKHSLILDHRTNISLQWFLLLQRHQTDTSKQSSSLFAAWSSGKVKTSPFLFFSVLGNSRTDIYGCSFADVRLHFPPCQSPQSPSFVPSPLLLPPIPPTSLQAFKQTSMTCHHQSRLLQISN